MNKMLDLSKKPLSITKKSYLSMLTRYEEARISGHVGDFFIKNTLVPETGKTFHTIQKDIQRGRLLRTRIKISECKKALMDFNNSKEK